MSSDDLIMCKLVQLKSSIRSFFGSKWNKNSQMICYKKSTDIKLHVLLALYILWLVFVQCTWYSGN